MGSKNSGVGSPRLLAPALVCLALAGCGTTLDPSGGNSPAASFLAFNGTAPPPLKPATNPIDELDCPHIEAFEGKSALRVGGQDNASVRHQFSMGEVARECTIVGNQISIKVGMQGRVLIGPAGSPGTFTVPVRIAVRSEKDQKIVASKSYRPTTTIPAGDSLADFTVISESLLIPYTRAKADEDYTVLVGFDQSGGEPADRRKKRRR